MSITTKGIDVSVPFYLRPVGFPVKEGNKSTARQISNWVDTKTPNIFKQLTYLTYGAIIKIVVGIFAGLIGLKKDNKILKYGGIVLALLGVGTFVGKNVAVMKLNGRLPKLEEDFFKEIDSFKGNQETINKSIKDLLESYDKTEIQSWLSSLFCEKPKDFTLHKAAIKVLKVIGGNEITKLLLNCAKNKNYPDEIRVNSLRNLSEITDKEVNATLLDCLRDKQNSFFIQMEAASLLGKRKDSELVTPLKDYLLSNGNIQNQTNDFYAVLQTVISAIGRIGGKEALQALKEINSKGILVSETQTEIDKINKL